MKWPMRFFWSSVRHVDRLRAEQDLRALNVALTSGITVQSGEMKSLEDFREQMGDALGSPMRFEEQAASQDEILKFLGQT
jgi:hypothetical protein